MYTNLQQFEEEIIDEFFETWDKAQLDSGLSSIEIASILRTAIRQAGELTVEASSVRPIQDSTLHDNTAHHSFNAAVDCARVAANRWLSNEQPQ